MAKNLTPEHLRCHSHVCPSVHRLDDGRLLIVGARAGVEEKREAGAMVGPEEFAVVISDEYFRAFATDGTAAGT